jgi:hypothetical protein
MKLKTNNQGKEKVSDLISRLKQYDQITGKYKLDYLSILPAVQMVLRIFPRKYCKDNLLKDNILREFVATIIPGSSLTDQNLVKMYDDNFYPFSNYCGYFVYDLARRSKRLFPGMDFRTLVLSEKTKVVQNALSGRELTRRLYKGAILMAQVSFYGAIYNEGSGCSLINFPGNNNGYSKEESSYDFGFSLFDNELTTDGQPW